MRHSILSVLGGVLVAASAVACGLGGGDEAGDEDIVVSVKAATVTREPIIATASASGTVFAKQDAIISAKLSGQLLGLGHIQNKQVHAGEVLAAMDAVDFFEADRDARQARASVAALEGLAAKRRALFEQGGLSKKDLDETELDLETAREELRAAERTVAAMSGAGGTDADGRATIRAPFAGVVAEQMQYGGEYVSEGTPLFHLVDLSEYLVKARFPDTVGPLIREGTQATVADEGFAGQPVTGVVSTVGATTDPESRTVEVWIRVTEPAGHLRAGDGALVTVETASDPDAIVVPESAVQLDASTGDAGSVVVVGTDGVAHLTPVKIGIRGADRVQVVEGLSGGETVVVEGNYALPDETKVEVEAPEAEAPAANGGDEKAP